MKAKQYVELNSISELYRLINYPGPAHPLISVIKDHARFSTQGLHADKACRLGFYSISCKQVRGALNYGRGYYDFSQGSLLFTAPAQVVTAGPEFTIEQGWVLFIHPDLIHGTTLGKRMHEYTFFNYEVSEALHVSEEEEILLSDCITKINQECLRGIDNHTQTILVSHLELLLNYCQRFYQRQFYTRTRLCSDVIQRFESLLKAYFANEIQIKQGLPDVGYFAERLNLSPAYLSDLLRRFTGKTTLEHIHLHLIEQAKNMLWGSDKSISDIAYQLGFEHPSQFSRLFKHKTGIAPSGYRNSN